ncbi:MAG: carbohydrate ABC transporter permease [Micropruina sp.]
MSVDTQAPALPQAPTRRRRHHANRKSTVLSIVMWMLAAYFLLPIAWLVISSTKNNDDLFTTFGLWFGNGLHLFDNLAKVFSVTNGIYVRWAMNTVLYAVVSAVGASLLATMAGYAFAKYDFPFKRVMFSTVLGAIMIPMTALAIPTYLLFANAGLTNTIWAVIVPSLVSPFGVFLMQTYASEAIPDSLLEAARVDGAGEGTIFWRVSLRMLGPGVITVLLFNLVATWNNYFLPLIMLSTSELYPLTVGLAQQQSAATAGSGAQALFSTVITGSMVAILPLIVAFLFLQRYWESGLATGAVKE